MTPALRWLLLEGLVPLLGASVIYAIWGGALYAVDASRSTFHYDWRAALDPFGWLYGAAVLAMQVVIKSISRHASTSLVVMSVFGLVVCVVVLLAAMAKRAGYRDGKVPKTLVVLSVALMAIILAAGYNVEEMPIPGAPHG